MEFMLDEFLPTVVDLSLVGSYAIVFVLIARLFLKKSPKIYSYVLWSVVLFRLVCPVSFESTVAIMPSQTVVQNQTSYVNEVVMPSVVFEVKEGAETSVNNDVVVETATEIPMSLIMFGVWMLGISTMVIYSAYSLVKTRKNLVGCMWLRDNIYLADGIKTPFVLGVVKPKIYLPSSINKDEMDFIIEHEKIHIKRFDHVTRVIAFFTLCVHFFNPLVWCAYILSAKDMEMSCDEAVMNKLGMDIKSEYSMSLLRLTTDQHFISPLAFSEGDTKERVKNVMKMKKTKLWVTGLTSILVLGLIVGLASNSSKDLSEKLQTYVVSDLELRYYGTLTPMLEATYPPDYYDASIWEGTLAFLHAVLPEYFLSFVDPDFEWNSDLLSVSTLEQVKSHVEMVYKMADFRVSSSIQDEKEYLLTVDVLPVNALTGLTEETLNFIKADENLVGNVDLMVQAVLSHLDAPQKAEVREEYTVQYTYEEEDRFYPNMDEVIALYERIVIFSYASSPL